jgi:hypothetical protein
MVEVRKINVKIAQSPTVRKPARVVTIEVAADGSDTLLAVKEKISVRN